MRQTEAYAQLRDLGGAAVGTREAAALWRTEEGTARRRLQSLAEAGLVTPIRRGLWSVEPDLDPFALAPYLPHRSLPTSLPSLLSPRTG
jgi:DeoR/GlpR family transcriptional regulator of sugar metabolism